MYVGNVFFTVHFQFIFFVNGFSNINMLVILILYIIKFNDTSALLIIQIEFVVDMNVTWFGFIFVLISLVHMHGVAVVP